MRNMLKIMPKFVIAAPVPLLQLSCHSGPRFSYFIDLVETTTTTNIQAILIVEIDFSAHESSAFLTCLAVVDCLLFGAEVLLHADACNGGCGAGALELYIGRVRSLYRLSPCVIDSLQFRKIKY